MKEWTVRDSFNRVKKVLSEPHLYFSKKEKEQGYKNVIVHYLRMVLVAFIPSVIMQALYDPQSRTLLETNPLSFLGAMILAIVSMTALVLIIIIPLFHGYLYLFGARTTLQKTYHVVVAAATPGLLFGWIPFVNILASLYTLVLNWYGVRAVHELSSLKAFIALILLPLVATVVGLFLL